MSFTKVVWKFPKYLQCNQPYNQMDPPQTRAISLAAKLVITGILSIILKHRTNPKKVSICIEPLYGFYWNREVLTAVGSDTINDIIHCVKSTTSAKQKIEAIRKLFKGAFYDRSVICPSRWGIWRSSITTYRLYELSPFTSRALILNSLESKHIASPPGLG